MSAAIDARVVRFEGRIAGFGTTSGLRIVAGLWDRSPFGRFQDVMIERLDGHRLLLAPSDEVRDYVSETYVFDEARTVSVSLTRLADGMRLVAGPLDVRVTVGGASALGRMLRIVPRPLARHPLWSAAIDPIARHILPGVRTAGTAGKGRIEYYGVTTARTITAIRGRFDDRDLGEVARLDPPVRFGFGSAPPAPQLVDVVTTIARP